MTGVPHRPSSSDGHPSGLAQKDARRSRSPLSGYAIARTVRQLI